MDTDATPAEREREASAPLCLGRSQCTAGILIRPVPGGDAYRIDVRTDSSALVDALDPVFKHFDCWGGFAMEGPGVVTCFVRLWDLGAVVTAIVEYAVWRDPAWLRPGGIWPEPVNARRPVSR